MGDEHGVAPVGGQPSVRLVGQRHLRQRAAAVELEAVRGERALDHVVEGAAVGGHGGAVAGGRHRRTSGQGQGRREEQGERA